MTYYMTFQLATETLDVAAPKPKTRKCVYESGNHSASQETDLSGQFTIGRGIKPVTYRERKISKSSEKPEPASLLNPYFE